MSTIKLENAGQFFEQLKNKIIEAAGERVLPAAGNVMLGDMKERIFSDGKDSGGGDIGSYSTKPIYAQKEQFVRKGSFKPQGKEGNKKKANGQPYKSMYLKQGYKELRDIQGRPTGKKDLRYSGSAERSIKVVQEGNRTLIAITEEQESKKLRGAEKQSGKTILTPSEREIDKFKETAISLLGKELEKLV